MTMLCLGYKQVQRDYYPFFQTYIGGKQIVFLIYVNNIIVTKDDLKERQLLKKKLLPRWMTLDLLNISSELR